MLVLQDALHAKLVVPMTQDSIDRIMHTVSERETCSTFCRRTSTCIGGDPAQMRSPEGGLTAQAIEEYAQFVRWTAGQGSAHAGVALQQGFRGG